jgi:transmembrane sensor
LFQVAHDATRPFSVSTETSRTTALGTQFQVQRDDDHVVVTLAEGSVAVEGSAHGGSASWQDQLRPGEQLSIDAKTAERSLHIVDTQLVTSWTLGRHVFRATPLHEALDEVNRYASKKVRLGDPSLADLPVAGNFVAGDSEVVVEAFSAVLPLRVVKGGEQELILFRRYSE